MPHTQLAADLLAWDRSLPGALALRDRVAQAEPFKLSRAPAIGERGLAKVIGWYRKPTDLPTVLRWVLKDRNRDEARVLGPLLGDDRWAPWSAHRPSAGADEASLQWLAAVGRVQPWVDDHLLTELTQLFSARQRTLWRPAADTLVALASTDGPVTAWVHQQWAAAAPDGLPKRWPKGPSLLPGATSAEGTHTARHLLVLAAGAWAQGLELSGFSPRQLARLGLPRDDADRSVVVTALAVCLGAERARDDDELLTAVARLAQRLAGGPLSEGAARELCDAVPGTPTEAAWLDALARSRWGDHGVPADGLWAWLETHAWALARGSADLADRIVAATDAEGALFAPVAGDPVEAARRAVADLSSSDWVAMNSPDALATRLCGARRLLEDPRLAERPWPALAALAGRDDALPGACAEVGACDLAVRLAAFGTTVPTFLRRPSLPREAVLGLAAIDNGFVATQVALQLERLLREEHRGGDASVRLLWQVLQADPPARTFQQLLRMLRVPEDAPLRAVVQTVSALDRCRDEGRPHDELAATFEELVRAARPLLDDSGQRALEGLSALVDDPAAQAVDPTDPEWALQLQRVIVGPRGDGGVLGWVQWLGDENRGEALVAAMHRLVEALTTVRQSEPAVSPDQVAQLRAGTEALLAATHGLGWPEATLLDRLLEQVRQRATRAETLGRRSAVAERRAAALLERADEGALLQLVAQPDDLEALPAETIRAVHHLLLAHQRFPEARRLARAVAHRVSLPSPASWLLPLFAAVAGGTFLVLDVGDAWLDVAASGDLPRFVASASAALLTSFLLLASNLSHHMATPTLSRAARWRRVVARVLPTYLQALLVSASVSALVMATLGQLGTPNAVRVWVMWSCLSLFLGMFLGLIVQGQRLTR